MMRDEETVEESTRRVLAEARVDIDVEYCKKHNIKFKSHGNKDNHEIDFACVDLFNAKSVEAAFEFLTRNR